MSNPISNPPSTLRGLLTMTYFSKNIGNTDYNLIYFIDYNFVNGVGIDDRHDIHIVKCESDNTNIVDYFDNVTHSYVDLGDANELHNFSDNSLSNRSFYRGLIKNKVEYSEVQGVQGNETIKIHMYFFKRIR